VNIILIISDTFRFDNLLGRGRPRVRTPNLDRFHNRAVSLTRLYTSSFPTIPHRTDLTTGRYGWPWYPWQHRANSGANHAPVLLREAGYVSQLICDCPHLFPAGFNLGFDGAIHLRGQETDIPFTRMNQPIEQLMPADKTRRFNKLFAERSLVDVAHWTNQPWRAEADRFPPRTAETAVRWLEENAEYHPFFLWVDFFDPHEPWDPPEYMVRQYDPDYDGAPMLHPNYGRAGDYTAAELRNLRAHYCAEAELVDRWVGRVLQKIDDLDLWRNSIVVFTTDHGFSIGEHDRAGKSNINPRDDRAWPIYPEVAHIPFLIAAPGIRGGREVDALLQPVDILPTLLDLARVKVKPPQPFHGRSFARFLRGRAMPALRECAIAASHIRGDGPKVGRWGKAVTPVLYTTRWAYAPVGAEGERELYDLDRDPGAARNVACRHPRVVEHLHAQLLGWLEGVGVPGEVAALFRRP
jgi:arylsulfatase A-like enzyme